jgi:hypothetical protein
MNIKPKRMPIKAADRISDEYDCPIVIIFALRGNGDTFSVVTYGKTKALCRHAADIGNKIAEAIMGGEIIPAQIEPTHLPDVPTAWEPKL